MLTSGEWAEGKSDRAHLSSLFSAEPLGPSDPGDTTDGQAGHLGGLLRKAPLTILGGIPPSPPGSQPLFLSLAKERVGLGDLERRAQAGVWQPQETHLPAVSRHLAWTPGANQAALGTARGIPTDALVWSQPGPASCYSRVSTQL